MNAIRCRHTNDGLSGEKGRTNSKIQSYEEADTIVITITVRCRRRRRRQGRRRRSPLEHGAPVRGECPVPLVRLHGVARSEGALEADLRDLDRHQLPRRLRLLRLVVVVLLLPLLLLLLLLLPLLLLAAGGGGIG